MGFFDFFKKKSIVEEVAPVVAEKVVLDFDQEEFDAKIARLYEIIREYERAHDDNQVIINTMDNEIISLRKSLKLSDEYIEVTNEELVSYKRFYHFFDDLRGKGLEVTNWHRLKPMDDYIVEAEKTMEVGNHNVQ